MNKKTIILVIIGLIVFSVMMLSGCIEESSIPKTEGKIAFDRDGDIWIMDAGSSNQKQLTHNSEIFKYPAWSYDSKFIAFQEGNMNGIGVINTDGANLRKITEKGISAGSPAWLPNGKIVFTKLDLVSAIRPVIIGGGPIQANVNPEFHYGIKKMNFDGSDTETIINLGSVAEVGIPACSINNKIAYVEVASSKVNSGIWTMDSNGKNRKQIVKSSSVDCPAWSPDGKRIAYEDDGDVYIIDSNGKGKNKVIINGKHPTWSPDGKRIAFERDGDIWILNVDGTDAKLLAKNGRNAAWSR
jgi:Tol biopolymer transport system component